MLTNLWALAGLYWLLGLMTGIPYFNNYTTGINTDRIWAIAIIITAVYLIVQLLALLMRIHEQYAYQRWLDSP